MKGLDLKFRPFLLRVIHLPRKHGRRRIGIVLIKRASAKISVISGSNILPRNRIVLDNRASAKISVISGNNYFDNGKGKTWNKIVLFSCASAKISVISGNNYFAAETEDTE